ncbi:hypothetical protein FM038_006970 [Shewanella eurypsychrophilus]|uniref:Uncharacterized protein n=1 Tax=Shewanella eurypsychrophilus TaxID=2593656 RepID=A0ABX6V3J4_9GAMM|nr:MULTISPECIES: hypothetical protein [Shewanella]QFU21918.1 hypothetical protein FS418_08550 [Shewanella sp. YLB-09]QPG57207.1 hypothetical protein FM038_006970 [Shewanella eurypsychrophilus]
MKKIVITALMLTLPMLVSAAPAKGPKLKEYNHLVDCYSYAQLLNDDLKMSRFKNKSRKMLDKIGFSYKDAQNKLEVDLRKAKRTTKKKNARKKLDICQKSYL